LPIALIASLKRKSNAIDFCQVAIKHYSHGADRADHRRSASIAQGFGFLRHGRGKTIPNSSDEEAGIAGRDQRK